MKTKEKGIDLGKLQAEYEIACKEHVTNSKAFVRAEDALEASKKKLTNAREALQIASKAVLN